MRSIADWVDATRQSVWRTAIVLALVTCTTGRLYAWVPPGVRNPLELAASKPLPYDPTRITVRFRTDIDRARIADILQEKQCSVSFAARYVPGLMDVRIPPGADFREYVELFAKRADVLYAEPCYLDYPAFVPNDPSYHLQWHFPQIGMPLAWDIVPTRGSSAVTVAVQDTGVAYENYGSYLQAPDLAGVTFVSPYDAVDGDGHPNDTDGHGTHVTGTIAQRTNNSVGGAGIADGIRIMPIRTLGTGGGTPAQFSDGVHYAVDHGAQIINYSGGGADSTTKYDAVIYAYNAGVLYVAAMGNSNTEDPSDGYPARYPEAMGVVATQYTNTRAWYSNWGADADISAPGGDLGADLNSDGKPDGVLQQTYTTRYVPTSGFSLKWFEGTSMATPHVTGVAALLWSQGVYTTRVSVRSRIESTAQDLGAAGKDNVYGYGLIRADRALSPWLMWAGTTGYVSDGVNPQAGDPDTSPAPTTFTFKAKYLDASGAPPSLARCVIQRLVCDPAGGVRWVKYKSLPMTLESGSVAEGAIYSVSTTLANYTLKYRFLFKTAGGSLVNGPPNNYILGPKLDGRPHLCWTGNAGFATDGVEPNAGRGKFRFQVMYTDSWGTAPSTYEVVVQRNGVLYARKTMFPETGGSYQTGKIYRTSLFITKPGAYRYRFRFHDGADFANGDPATWNAGPDIVTGGAAVTSLVAIPIHNGVQITFNLASAADVTATVMNVAGRPVRSIASDKALEAGLQTLMWDRRADNGLPTPAGLYLIKVTARNQDGEQSTVMATVSLR